MHGKSHSMHRTPEHEFPCRTMPQTTDKHRKEVVEVGAEGAFAVAAKGDIKVIAKPRGERNVPATPEFGKASALIRGIEVDAETETHDQRQTDSHIRVTGEVAIYLHRITEDSHQRLHPGVELRIVEYQVVVLRYIVGDQGFLDDTNHDEPQAAPDHVGCGALILLKLRQEIVGPHYGAGHECREEGEEEEIVDP